VRILDYFQVMTRKKTTPLKAIGNRIKIARMRVGQSQTAFGKSVGRSERRQVKQWEDGTGGLSIDSLYEIQRHTRASLDWLFGLGDDEFRAVGETQELAGDLERYVRAKIVAAVEDEVFKGDGPYQPTPEDWRIDPDLLLRHVIEREIELLHAWLRWYNQAVELSAAGNTLEGTLAWIAESANWPPRAKGVLPFHSRELTEYTQSVYALVAVAKIADAIEEPEWPAVRPHTLKAPADYRIEAKTPRALMAWLRRVKKAKGWRTPVDTTPQAPPPLPPVLQELVARLGTSPKRNKRKARAE